MLNGELEVNKMSLYFRSTRVIYNKAIRGGVASRIYYLLHDFKIKSEKARSCTVFGVEDMIVLCFRTASN